jgi:SMI1 / KNR4 family.
MSYSNYEKALTLAKSCNGYFIGEGKSISIINEAQNLLDIKFSKQLRNYLGTVGFIEFDGHEFYGIVKDDFSSIPEGNIVEYALFDRKKYNLPKEWIPIYNFDDGYMAYLDYSYLNDEGEPRVIMTTNTGKNYKVLEVIAEDLGDFLLQMIEDQLANQ